MLHGNDIFQRDKKNTKSIFRKEKYLNSTITHWALSFRRYLSHEMYANRIETELNETRRHQTKLKEKKRNKAKIR